MRYIGSNSMNPETAQGERGELWLKGPNVMKVCMFCRTSAKE